MNRTKARTATGVALVATGIIVAASLVAPYAAERAASDYSEYVAEAARDDGAATDGSAFPSIDWDALLAQNPDVVGWVRVEGTPIDCPVVQAREDDPQRYLDRALDGSPNGHGCPYVDDACGGAGGPCVLVYGHNMADGSMFAAFAGYTCQATFDEHREILFMTPGHDFRLEAVAAREVSARGHSPRTSFASAAELSAHLAAEAAASQATGRVPTRTPQVFEFACCSYGAEDARTIVYAVEPAACTYGPG